MYYTACRAMKAAIFIMLGILLLFGLYLALIPILARPIPSPRRYHYYRRYTAAEVRQNLLREQLSNEMKAGDLQAVKTTYHNLRSMGFEDNGWLLLQVAEFCARKGDYAGAKTYYDDLLDPPETRFGDLFKDPRVRVEWVLAAKQVGSLDIEARVASWEAELPLSLLQSGITIDAGKELRLADEAKSGKNFKSAATHFRKAAELAPDAFDILNRWGDVEFKLGHRAEAKRLYIRAYALAPRELRPILAARKDLSQADIQAAQAIELAHPWKRPY